jgi:hypothetical protein
LIVVRFLGGDAADGFFGSIIKTVLKGKQRGGRQCGNKFSVP